MKNLPRLTYQEYLQTAHWQGMRQKYILNDRLARCWICELSNNLLLHHKNYNQLYREKIGVDVIRLCDNCHKLVHFLHPLAGIWLKLPLNTKLLIARLYYLKCKYLVLKYLFSPNHRQYYNYRISLDRS